MGIPFETLLPYGVVITMFAVTGAGLGAIGHYANDGRKPRARMDEWDRQMMERDLRMTGKLRGQSDRVLAPKGFELNKPIKVEKNWT